MRPTKSVPGGCVLGLFALGLWMYAALCAYGIWRAAHSNSTVDYSGSIKSLLLHALTSFALGLILLIIGWKLALRVGDYDAWDPDQPRIKF